MGLCLICGKRQLAMHNKNTCCYCFTELRQEINDSLDKYIEHIEKFEAQQKLNELENLNENVEGKEKQRGQIKMKRQKQEVGGNYISAGNIGQGKKGDRDFLTILTEGEIEDSSYGERLVINIMTKDKIEKLFNLSPTNENTLIDLFGEQTEKWVDQKIEVLLESCNVGKTGLQITILTTKNIKE